jgi:hypothetical protein
VFACPYVIHSHVPSPHLLYQVIEEEKDPFGQLENIEETSVKQEITWDHQKRHVETRRETKNVASHCFRKTFVKPDGSHPSQPRFSRSIKQMKTKNVKEING